MAAPHVAGVAALLWGNFPIDGSTENYLAARTPLIRRAILNSARDTPDLEDKVATGGRLDAMAAHDYMYTLLNNPISLRSAMAKFELRRPPDFDHVLYRQAVHFASNINTSAAALHLVAQRLDTFNEQALEHIITMRSLFRNIEDWVDQGYTLSPALTADWDAAIAIYNGDPIESTIIYNALQNLQQAYNEFRGV